MRSPTQTLVPRQDRGARFGGHRHAETAESEAPLKMPDDMRMPDGGGTREADNL